MSSPTSMEEEEFDTCLALAIGGGAAPRGSRRPPVQFNVLFPATQVDGRQEEPNRKKGEKGVRKMVNIHNKEGDGDGRSAGGGGARKKLRLTKEQSTMLEDTFRARNILSHAQKHELARQLSLSARQVEVWFQNRRARTKLKQTEMDCELLRRWGQRLSDENVRLRHEVVELRSAATTRTAGSKLCVQLTATTAAVVRLCPSCEKLTVVSVSAGGGGEMSRGSSCSS